MPSFVSLDTSSDLRLETTITQSICEMIDTPRSLGVWLLLEYKEWDQYLDLKMEPDLYDDACSFRDDYLVSTMLKKSPNLPLGIDRAQVAKDSFYESEKLCAVTNGISFDTYAYETSDVVRGVRKNICRVLGDLRKTEMNKVISYMRFGPGATTGVRGRGSVPSDKYDADMHLTAELVPYYRQILGDRLWEVQTNPQVVEGSKFFTVRKDAQTDRGACFEPTLNSYVQLGTGQAIREKLRDTGVDLNDQSRNQRLAREAWTSGLATIDLSKASDMIAYYVVKDLLPDRWFKLLDLSRSRKTFIDGHYHELQKFSSMGNGYTFELESLIFLAVARWCVPKHNHRLIGIYGDDIIVPQENAVAVIEALKFLGFKVNENKTFLAGKFYESCGTDWFQGQSVRPFFLRGRGDSNIPYSLQIANAIRLYSQKSSDGEFCDKRYLPLWRAVVKTIPHPWDKCFVPPQLGDVGIIVSRHEAGHDVRRHGGGHCGWMVKTISMKPKSRMKTTFGRLLVGLTRAGSPEPIFTTGWEPKRGFMGLPRPKKTFVTEWSDGLTWR